jgi:hypothetical protein
MAENTQYGEQSVSAIRKIVSLISVVLAFAVAVAPTIAAEGGGVRIGFYVIDPSDFQDKMQFITAEIVNDTLSQHIERQFDQEAGLYAYVERLYEKLGVDRQSVTALTKALASREKLLVFKYDFEIVVVADLSIEERGYLVRVTSVDLRSGPGNIDWRGTPNLAVLQPTGSFVDIEKEMEAIARLIVRRFTGIDTRRVAQERKITPVLFWCIQSTNPKDQELMHISRRLTLELPFFLAEHSSALADKYSFTGMSARDYIGECLESGYGGSEPRRPYLDFNRYTYVVSGVAGMDRNRTGQPSLSVKYLFDWRTEGYGIPEIVSDISPELDNELLDKTAKDFLRIFSTAVRRELVKSAQSNLSFLGYYNAKVDGIVGSETKEAISAFQKELGLEITGTITPELAEMLRKKVRRKPSFSSPPAPSKFFLIK